MAKDPHDELTKKEFAKRLKFADEQERTESGIRTSLEKDPAFKDEFTALQDVLIAADKRNRKAVIHSFKALYKVGFADGKELAKCLASVDRTTRVAIEACARFCTRFGVTVDRRIIKNQVTFKVSMPSADAGFNFHVQVNARGQIRPLQWEETDEGNDRESEDDYRVPLHADGRPLLMKVRGPVDDLEAKFLLIEDKYFRSTLSEIEKLAYHPSGVTVILHKGHQDYLFFLMGENVRAGKVRDLLPVLTEFQQEFFEREGRGRGRRQVAEIRSARGKEGPKKIKDSELAERWSKSPAKARDVAAAAQARRRDEKRLKTISAKLTKKPTKR
jgi:hypothetical protein